MADKVTLDFENGIITWDTDSQKGTEHCPDLAERKAAILAAMGYEVVDLTPTVTAINAYANGELTEEEFFERLEAQASCRTCTIRINDFCPIKNDTGAKISMDDVCDNWCD